MLLKVREEILLAKLQVMILLERRKDPHDPEVIAALERLVRQVEEQKRKRPQFRNGYK